MMARGDRETGNRYSRRAILAAGPILPLLAPCRGIASSPRVDITVSPDDTGVQASIARALEQASLLGRPATIGLEPGIYREKPTIAVPGVTLVGLGRGAVIAYGAAAGLRRPDGSTWGTGGSATLTIEAPGVTLAGLTIRNDFDYIDDLKTHASGGAQAVALSIGRRADRTLIERCAIEGYQDTLYVATRSLFRRCRIAGGVDFIFGGAAALFQHCDIVTRFVPDAPESGFVAAPSTLAEQRYGFVFDRCHLARERGVPDGSTWLGRPWRAGGNMAILGSTVFLRCRLDAHIKREGWTAMGFTDPSGIKRMLQPSQARLFEWKSTGPGAAPPGPGRRRLSDAQAGTYTSDAILQGWVP